MVVDHAGGLHEGVADGRADEAETAAAQLPAHLPRLRRAGGNFRQRLPGIAPRPAAHELPDIGVKSSIFPLRRQKRPGVANGGGDFQPVANNAGIGQQFGNLGVIIVGDFDRIKVVKSGAIGIALAKYKFPRKPGLRPLQYQKLEQPPVVMQRNAPLGIVIGDAQRRSGPGAAGWRHYGVHTLKFWKSGSPVWALRKPPKALTLP